MIYVNKKGTLAIDGIDMYDINRIEINEIDEIIDVYVRCGFLSAKINYLEVKSCDYLLKDDDKENYSGEIISIIKDGKLNNGL